MAIEDLKTKGDLERFVEDLLENLPTNAIRGLPEALAARTIERFSLGTNRSPVGEAEEVLEDCEFIAPSNMTALAIGTLDAELGFSIGRLWVGAVNQGPEIHANVNNRATLSQTWPIILKKGDVVQLRAVGNGSGTIYADHTALTIVRLS